MNPMGLTLVCTYSRNSVYRPYGTDTSTEDPQLYKPYRTYTSLWNLSYTDPIYETGTY